MSEAPAKYGDTSDVLRSVSPEVSSAIAALNDQVKPAQADEVVDWLTHLRVAKGLAPRTIETYCKGIMGFLVWLNSGGQNMSTLTVEDIDDWQKMLYIERQLAPSTRRHQLTVVRQFFEWQTAYRDGHNPAQHAPAPRLTKYVPRKYSTRELTKLLDTCSDDRLVDIRDYALMLFIYATGARREEACSLRLDQITLSRSSGRVRFFGKGAKERELSFDRPVVEVLSRWLEMRESIEIEDRSHLWCNVAGAHTGKLFKLRTVDSIIERRCKQARIPNKGLHSLRVTFATDLYDSGVGVEIIQVLLGHEDINTTRRYIVISEKQQRARMPKARLNEVTGGKSYELPLWLQQKQQHDE